MLFGNGIKMVTRRKHDSGPCNAAIRLNAIEQLMQFLCSCSCTYKCINKKYPCNLQILYSSPFSHPNNVEMIRHSSSFESFHFLQIFLMEWKCGKMENLQIIFRIGNFMIFLQFLSSFYFHRCNIFTWAKIYKDNWTENFCIRICRFSP